ncbi:hypothetical protein [Coxiella-like endosymbiont]|uniref:hypothetical protein n=1 Tax=Coxiella-like endosymbiont TaxID=1592897 RepID=UPI00215B068F|nr:hypothetical protein [Coxiella-like endosymbiont]UVE59375.1 hypothetical protein LG660_03100 [Coxiella-like endosymbiont]
MVDSDNSHKKILDANKQKLLHYIGFEAASADQAWKEVVLTSKFLLSLSIELDRYYNYV